MLLQKKFWKISASICFFLLLSSCYQRHLVAANPPPFELYSTSTFPLAVTYDGKVLKNYILIASLIDENRSKYLDAFGQPLLNEALSEKDNLFYYSFLWDIIPLNEEKDLLEKNVCTTDCFIDLSDSVADFEVSALRFKASNDLANGFYRLVLRIGDGSPANEELLRFSQEFELLPSFQLPANSKLILDGLLSSKAELDPDAAIPLSADIPLGSNAITVILPRMPSSTVSKLIFNNMHLATTAKYNRIKIWAATEPGIYKAEIFENNDLQTPVTEAELEEAIVVFEDDPSSVTPKNRQTKIILQIEDDYGQIYPLNVVLKGQV